MKERIKKLEKRHNSKKSDSEKLIALAEKWKSATSNKNWARAAAIRKKAQYFFDANPAWMERHSGLRLPKILFMEWNFFVNWPDKKVQHKYKLAVQDGFHPGVSLINK